MWVVIPVGASPWRKNPGLAELSLLGGVVGRKGRRTGTELQKPRDTERVCLHEFLAHNLTHLCLSPHVQCEVQTPVDII